MVALRIVLALTATLSMAMWQSGGCGYTPDPLKGEGEPCTRSDECESRLTCRGGVCMSTAVDAGADAGSDSGLFDSGLFDSGIDAGTDAGDTGDASTPDGGDASTSADASADAAVLDSGPADADGAVDAAADAG